MTSSRPDVTVTTTRGEHVPAPRPTVVLVHGAFAESSSWNGVIARLQAEGLTVIASHALPASRPDAVADVVLRAVRATSAAHSR